MKSYSIFPVCRFWPSGLVTAYLSMLDLLQCLATFPLRVLWLVIWPLALSLLPAFQCELRHGPFYYVKQPALTTDPVDVVPQDGRNDFYCWVCHREGQVLCCELCPRVYHAKCLKLAAEPEGDWFCPECEVLRTVYCMSAVMSWDCPSGSLNMFRSLSTNWKQVESTKITKI